MATIDGACKAVKNLQHQCSNLHPDFTISIDLNVTREAYSLGYKINYKIILSDSNNTVEVSDKYIGRAAREAEYQLLKKQGKIKMITITKKKYYNLLVAEETLDRLEHGGVDNWDWYNESLGNDMEEFEEKLWNEIMGKENG